MIPTPYQVRDNRNLGILQNFNLWFNISLAVIVIFIPYTRVRVRVYAVHYMRLSSDTFKKTLTINILLCCKVDAFLHRLTADVKCRAL